MYKVFLMVCTLFVGGCSFIGTNYLHDIPTEQVTYESAKGYTVTTTDSLASCYTYALVDEEGREMQFSDDVKKNLYCFPPSIAPNDMQMVVSDGLDLLMYTFSTATLTPFFDMTAYEGTSIVGWNSDGTALIVAVVDQLSIPTLTRLIKFEKVDGTWEEASTHDVKINMVCGGICSPGPDDVQLLDDDTIQYRTWDQVPYDLEGEDAIRTLNL